MKLLFGNVCAAINLNGSLRENLSIEKGSDKGVHCHLFFFDHGEVLTHIIKKIVAKGRMRGISLPGNINQQLISQYEDNSSHMVKGDK